MTEYVLGFLFSPDLSEVVLILKNKPKFQKGRFNGVGGRVEANEKPLLAMQREFKEETMDENDLFWFNWVQFATFKDGDAVIHRFTTEDENYKDIKSPTDEQVFIIKVDWIEHLIKNKRAMPSISYLIPMALNKINNPETEIILINF